MPGARKPRVAVFKFASCDGCQLTLLDCENELLAIANAIDIADFREASSAVLDGPYDLSLVEGSVTTQHDARRIKEIRAASKVLVTIGACATAGGIQALRNFGDVEEFTRAVYARPEFISTLATSTPIRDHVSVDFELRGCPISKGQLVELVSSYLGGRQPNVPTESVCIECKRRGNVCVLVAPRHPVPRSGHPDRLGAICPAFHRGCYGCFGPQDNPNAPSLIKKIGELGMTAPEIQRAFRTFNAAAPAFREASEATGARKK